LPATTAPAGRRRRSQPGPEQEALQHLEAERQLDELESRLGLKFKRRELLREGMTHTSWINERGAEGRDNERLEYLGDAVLELVAAEYLFKRFPTYDEGQLTQIRSSLVSTVALAGLGERLRLGEALRLGRGAAKSGARRLTSLHANAFEALIGAVFLDQGYRKAGSIFLSRIGDLSSWTDPNFKGRMQALAQERFGLPPVYRTSPDGDARSRQYVSQVSVEGGPVLGEGRGGTKQTAEQGAARAALDALVAPVSKRRRRRSRPDAAGAALTTPEPAGGAQLSPAPEPVPVAAAGGVVTAAPPAHRWRRSRGSMAAPPVIEAGSQSAPAELAVVSSVPEAPTEIAEAAPARRRRRRPRSGSAGAEVTAPEPAAGSQPPPAPAAAPATAADQAASAAHPAHKQRRRSRGRAAAAPVLAPAPEAEPAELPEIPRGPEVPTEIAAPVPARRRRRRPRSGSAGGEAVTPEPAPDAAEAGAIAAGGRVPEIGPRSALGELPVISIGPETPTEVVPAAPPAPTRRRRSRGISSARPAAQTTPAAAPASLPVAPSAPVIEPAPSPGPAGPDDPAEPAGLVTRPRTHRGHRGGRRRSGRAATPSP
jgi:ribonuclease-3